MPDLFDFRPPPRPSNPEADLRGAMTAALRHVENGESIPAGVITAAMRVRIEARLADLRYAMRAGTEQDIAAAYLTFVDMRGGFKPTSGDLTMAFNRLNTADLASVPLWAVGEAAQAFRRAQIGAGVTRPTSGQLRKQAEDLAAPFFAELVALERVIRAEIAAEPTGDELARKRTLAQKMRELAANLSAPGASKRRSG